MTSQQVKWWSVRALVAGSAFAGAPSIVAGAPVFTEAFDAGTLSGWDVQKLCTSLAFVQLNAPDAASGGYLDMRPNVQSVAVGRAGIERDFAGRVFSQAMTEYLFLEADVRFISGAAGGELVPMLRQGGTVFMPTGAGIVFSTGVWTRPAGMAFALLDFRDGLGNPLAAQTLTEIGFGVRLTGGPTSVPPMAGRYHADNVALSIVPSPAAGAAAALALILPIRRKRT